MASKAIELEQAETRLTQLINELSGIDEVLITRDGLPIARLLPAAVPPDRVPGSARGVFTVPDDFDAPVDEFEE